MCTETYFENQVPNVHFVPVTINYERVLESETFPYELVGEQKVKESLIRLVKSSKILNKNFGKIYVTLSDPISLKEFSQSKESKIDIRSPQGRDLINTSLGYEIVYTL